MKKSNKTIQNFTWLFCLLSTFCYMSCTDGTSTAARTLDKHIITEDKKNTHADVRSHEEEEEHHDESEDNHDDESEEEHDGHAHSGLSTDKAAVIRASKKLGIQLSGKAQKIIGIKLKPVIHLKESAGHEFLVPRQSLVFYEHAVGLYMKRDNWFNMLNVIVIKQKKNYIHIKAPLLRRRDFIVIKGVPLLRLAHLEAFGASGHGHGH